MKIPLIEKITTNLLGDVSKTEHLLLQEIRVKKGSLLAKKTKMDILKELGIVVMAAKTEKAKRYRINMPFNAKLKQGSIIAMGTARQLDEIENYTKN